MRPGIGSRVEKDFPLRDFPVAQAEEHGPVCFRPITILEDPHFFGAEYNHVISLLKELPGFKQGDLFGFIQSLEELSSAGRTDVLAAGGHQTLTRRDPAAIGGEASKNVWNVASAKGVEECLYQLDGWKLSGCRTDRVVLCHGHLRSAIRRNLQTGFRRLKN